MQDIPQFAQMQHALFPFMGSLIFVLLNIYIYKILLQPLSSKPSISLILKIFVFSNVISCIAYLFLRDNPHVPYAIYFLLSFCLGITFLLVIATFIHHCLYFVITILFQQFKDSIWRYRIQKGIIILSLIMLIFGTYQGMKKPEVIHQVIKVNNLNKGLKIAILSDMHIGGLIKQDKVKEIVDITNDLHADLIFLIGDIVDSKLKDAQGAVDELKHLKANDGIFYVLGNHEYFHDIQNIINKLQSLGFHTLINQSHTLKDTLNIAGIADFVGYRMGYLQPDIKQTFAHINPSLPTILLSHQPKVIYSLQTPYDDKVDIVVSGHTHGGQIFPLSLAVLLQQPYISGLYTLKNTKQTKVYVSEGSGFWGPPIRIGSRKEITLLELQPF